MALTPTINYEVQAAATKIFIEDTTVYGDGVTNPSRAQCLVNFFLWRRPSTGEEVIDVGAYDETSASSVLPAITKDGWYRMKIEITKETGGGWAGADFAYTIERNIIVKDRLCLCWSEAGYELFQKKPCGCECSDKLNEWYCMEAQIFCGIEELVAQFDMPSAVLALERLTQECALLTDCGC